MPLHTLYASAPQGIALLRTVQVDHPSFAAPYRWVEDGQDLTARIETGATVVFEAFPFSTRRAPLNDTGRVEKRIDIGDPDGSVLRALDVALEADAAPITVTTRYYRSDDPLTIAGAIETETLNNVQEANGTISAVLTTADHLNRRAPKFVFTRENSPGLNR